IDRAPAATPSGAKTQIAHPPGIREAGDPRTRVPAWTTAEILPRGRAPRMLLAGPSVPRFRWLAGGIVGSCRAGLVLRAPFRGSSRLAPSCRHRPAVAILAPARDATAPRVVCVALKPSRKSASENVARTSEGRCQCGSD